MRLSEIKYVMVIISDKCYPLHRIRGSLNIEIHRLITALNNRGWWLRYYCRFHIIKLSICFDCYFVVFNCVSVSIPIYDIYIPSVKYSSDFGSIVNEHAILIFIWNAENISRSIYLKCRLIVRGMKFGWADKYFLWEYWLPILINGDK